MVFEKTGFEQGSSAGPAARIEMRSGEVKSVVKGLEDTVMQGGYQRKLEQDALEILATETIFDV